MTIRPYATKPRAALLHGDIFLRDLPKRAIEHGMVMLEQNADFSVFIDGQLAGR
jgi:hypothetical protein